MPEADADGRWPRRQRAQGAIEEAAAVAEASPARTEAEAGHEQHLGHELVGPLRLRDVVGIELGLAARIPDVKAQRLGRPVGDRQADPARLAIAVALAPPVERRQRIELALDRPVGADRSLAPADQPGTKDLLPLD